MAVSKFDRSTCSAVAEKALEALKPLATQLGLHVKKLPGRYTGSSFTMKIEFSVLDEEGVAMTGIRRDYLNQCSLFGLKEEWLDKVFTSGMGNSFKITGLKPSNHKYPVIAENTQTKRSYKFSAYSIINAMGKGE